MKRRTFTDTEDHTKRINVWTGKFVMAEGIAMNVLWKKFKISQLFAPGTLPV